MTGDFVLYVCKVIVLTSVSEYNTMAFTIHGVIRGAGGGGISPPPRNHVMFEVISEHTEYL